MAKFKGLVQQENVAIHFSGSFAPGGQTATINSDNLEVRVGDNNTTFVATQVATFTLPIIENATDFHVKLYISAYADAQPGTRAILVTHLGDTTDLATAPLPGSKKEFLQSLEATLPAGVDVRAILFLLVERNSGDGNQFAYLQVHALDFNLG